MSRPVEWPESGHNFAQSATNVCRVVLVCNFFTAKCIRSAGCGLNLDDSQYQYEPITFVYSVVPSPCEAQPYKPLESVNYKARVLASCYFCSQ